MNQTFEQRIQSIENELKEIRKELEDSLARYKNQEWFMTKDVGTPWKDLFKTKCIWDSIPVEDRYKPMSLSCSCRKCSAYC